MKHIGILIINGLTITSTLALPLLVSCGQKKAEPVFLSVHSKDKIASFCIRLTDKVDGFVKLELVDNQNLLKLQSNSVLPIGNLLDFNVEFLSPQTVGTETTFKLKVSYKTLSNQDKSIVISGLKIIYDTEDYLEKQCNDYAEANNSNFLNNLTMAPHDYFPDYCSDFFCNSDAEACINWAHHPGYSLWNPILHSGGSLDNDNVSYQIFDYPGIKSFSRLTKERDYKQLDHALSLSTVGTINVQCEGHEVGHVYHGFEPDEIDIENFINTTTNKNIKNDPANSWTDADVDKLDGKSYIDLGYFASSFDYSYSYDWAETSTKYGAAPFLDLTVDSSVTGAYISYSRRAYYGLYLSRPENYQLLISRGAKITISDASLIPPTSTCDKNILYLKGTISLNI